MRTMLCLFAIILGPGVAGCGRDKVSPPPPTAGSGAQPAPAAPAATAGVELFINDLTVGVVQPAQIAAWSRLDSLVPGDARKLGTWELVVLEGARPKPTEIPHPSIRRLACVASLRGTPDRARRRSRMRNTDCVLS